MSSVGSCTRNLGYNVLSCEQGVKYWKYFFILLGVGDLAREPSSTNVGEGCRSQKGLHWFPLALSQGTNPSINHLSSITLSNITTISTDGF